MWYTLMLHGKMIVTHPRWVSRGSVPSDNKLTLSDRTDPLTPERSCLAADGLVLFPVGVAGIISLRQQKDAAFANRPLDTGGLIRRGG